MAQWKETLEPYIKVYERIKTATIVPTAGEDLIVGATIISDSGPTTPVLITSQKDFLNTYASRDLTKNYVNSLNDLYLGDDKTLASTMWLNAYRLAGSTNMLVVRASKGADLSYVKPLVVGGTDDIYIIRDGQLLKRVPSFKLVIDELDDQSQHPERGWAISVNEVGIIGNLTSDKGPEYDYYVRTLGDLVEALNDTSKFFSPKYSFYEDAYVDVPGDEPNPNAKSVSGDVANCVVFEEVYLAENFLDRGGFKNASYIKGDTRKSLRPEVSKEINAGSKYDGLAYITAAELDWTEESNVDQQTVDLNGSAYSGTSGFVNVDYYATNVYNSNTELKVRIRRFNHDAVVTRDSEPTIEMSSKSPYRVLPKVLQIIESAEEADKQKYYERDFYEVAVLDPSLDSDPLYFNIGNIPGRGDMTVEEVNEALKMINLNLPDDLHELNLNYWGFASSWKYTGDTFFRGDNLDGVYVINGAPENDANHSLPSSISANIGSQYEKVLLVPDNVSIHMDNYEYWKYVPAVETTYRLNESDESAYDAAASAQQITVEAGTTPETLAGTYANAEHVGWVIKVGTDNPEYYIVLEIAGTAAAVVASSETEYNAADHKVEVENLTEVTVESFGAIEEGTYVLRNTLTSTEYNEDGFEGVAVWYEKVEDETAQIFANLTLPTKGENKSYILTVSDDDLKKSISSITEDEIYTVEGLTDLGNTSLDFQSYLCNMAKNENYFYPISTINSTNYLAIANYRSKLAQDSHKLYTSAPWDIDTGTVGFKFYASPSVIYWEAVAKNRSMDREFASVFGFNSTGQVLYTKPVTEFTKKQRQLLLSKQINTVMWNTQSQTWNMNDCYTLTSENHILNEDGNSRLFIRINKAIPTLLKPLIGRKINDVTYADAEDILKYWFKRTIQPMQYTVDDYRITVSGLDENDDEARRQNKMYVLVECRFARSLKYIIVYSDAIDMGMEFTGEI